MKALIQRVKSCSVKVEDEVVGSIDKGILVLLGVADGDARKDADYLVDKVVNLRIFEDEEGRMNRSLLDFGGEILVVSQFTLLGDCRKGRRPSFIQAAKPDEANSLYEYFVNGVKDRGVKTETGTFQAMMDVSLVNWGPVTLMLESKK